MSRVKGHVTNPEKSSSTGHTALSRPTGMSMRQKHPDDAGQAVEERPHPRTSGFDFSRLSLLPPPTPPPNPSGPSLLIQRKCATCAEKEKDEERVDESAVRVQPLLKVGAPDDALEREAELTAERIVQGGATAAPPQRQAGAPSLQRVTQVGPLGQGASSGLAVQNMGVEARLQSPRGGQPLTPGLRRSMERHFEADFSAVRIHDSSQDRADADSLGARAFTYGSHVYLGSGARADDVRLLAHELTHVVQQGGAARRMGAPAVRHEPLRVRRSPANRWYGLQPMVKGPGPGTRTHEFVLPRVMRANSTVFSEVNIPGGNRATSLSGLSSLEAQGRADLYVASTTLGLRFDEAGKKPSWLPASAQLRRGSGTFDHSRLAAPAATTGMGKVAARHAGGLDRVERIDKAPPTIQVGDLKPRAEAELLLGVNQLRSYETGIASTAKALSDFARDNPSLVSAGSWNPSVSRVSSQSVTIPADLLPGAAGRPILPVVLFEGEHVIDREPRRAHLQVDWAPAHPGILTYEFIPVSGGGASGVSTLRGLSSGGAPPLQGLMRSLREAPERQAGRVRDEFDLQRWLGDWQGWKTQHGRPFERGRGARELLHLETAREIARRSSGSVPTPTDAAQLMQLGQQMLHWEEWGSLHGRMRSVFGRLYVRTVELYERASTWVRERFHRTGPRVPSTGLASRVARLAFTVLRTFATAAAAQVTHLLGNSAQEGVRGQLELLFSDGGLGVLTSRLDSLRTMVDAVEQRVVDTVDTQLQSILGPFGAWVDRFSEIESVFSTLSTVVDVARWAVRIVGCGAPPLLGCLWSVIGVQVLEGAAAHLFETCWFRQEVLVPAMNQVSVIRDAPRWIAQQLHGGLARLVPEQARPWLGTIPRELPALRAEDVACGGNTGRPSADPATAAFLDVVREFGEEYASELLRTLQYLTRSGGETRLSEAMMRQVQSLGREHRAAGGSIASLRSWRGTRMSNARSWSEAVGAFRTAILDGSATGGPAAPHGGLDATLTRPVPTSPRAPVRIGPFVPGGSQQERGASPGAGALSIEF